MTEPVKLRLEQVTKRFDVAGATPTIAVQDFTLDVARGEFLVIVGPSGCGKTTVLNILAGLELPSGGGVTIDGRPIVKPGPERGVMFQDYALFPWQTVHGNIEFGLRHGAAGRGLDAVARERRVRSCIELVGLSGAETKYPHQLSGGNKTNTSTLFITLEPWDDRSINAEQITRQILMKGAAIRDGLVLAFNPPPIRGLGTAGGLEFYLQNRADGNAGHLAEVMQQFIGALGKRKDLQGITPFFRPTAPQLARQTIHEALLMT